MCSDSEASVSRLLPYVTRGVTRMELRSDLHVEASSEAVAPLIVAVRAKSEKKLLQAIDMVPGARELFVAYDPFDFALDMGKLTLDVRLDDAGAEAALALSFSDRKSTWTRAFISHPELADVPPAAFLKLPDDAVAANYAHGFDAVDLEKARALVPSLLEFALAADVDAATGSALGAAVGKTLGLAAAPMVFGRGIDLPKARAAAEALKSAKPKPTMALARAAIAQAAGWEIFGIQRPISEVGPNVKAYVAVAQQLAKAKADDSAFTVKAGAAIAGLPASTLHYELGVHAGQPKKGASPAAAAPVHFVIVADGDHTWVVEALDLPIAVAKAKGLLPGASAAGTLASRADLGSVRSARGNAGGFLASGALRLDGPLKWAPLAAAVSEGGTVPNLLDAIIGANVGAIIPFSIVEAGPRAGSVGALIYSMRIPKESVGDFMGAGSWF